MLAIVTIYQLADRNTAFCRRVHASSYGSLGTEYERAPFTSNIAINWLQTLNVRLRIKVTPELGPLLDDPMSYSKDMGTVQKLSSQQSTDVIC